jgi:hypothetical protein
MIFDLIFVKTKKVVHEKMRGGGGGGGGEK